MINSGITHAKSNHDSYFVLKKEYESYNTWWCTHGAWYVDCNNDGTIRKEILQYPNYTHLGNFKLIEFYTTDEYMEIFGNTNPYETATYLGR